MNPRWALPGLKRNAIAVSRWTDSSTDQRHILFYCLMIPRSPLYQHGRNRQDQTLQATKQKKILSAPEQRVPRLASLIWGTVHALKTK